MDFCVSDLKGHQAADMAVMLTLLDDDLNLGQSIQSPDSPSWVRVNHRAFIPGVSLNLSAHPSPLNTDSSPMTVF